MRDARLLWGVESRADSGRKATPSGVRGSGGRGRSRTCFERFCRPPPSRSATRPEPRVHVTRTGRTNMEQAAGIEPASRAWKARAQPLCHACVLRQIVKELRAVRPGLRDRMDGALVSGPEALAPGPTVRSERGGNRCIGHSVKMPCAQRNARLLLAGSRIPWAH